MSEHISMTNSSLIGEEEQPHCATERVAGIDYMAHPLRVRRHGEDPEVWDAEMGPMDSLPPGLAVAEELAPEGGLVEPLPRDWHSCRRPLRGRRRRAGAVPTGPRVAARPGADGGNRAP